MVPTLVTLNVLLMWQQWFHSVIFFVKHDFDVLKKWCGKKSFWFDARFPFLVSIESQTSDSHSLLFFTMSSFHLVVIVSTIFFISYPSFCSSPVNYLTGLKVNVVRPQRPQRPRVRHVFPYGTDRMSALLWWYELSWFENWHHLM